MAGIKECCQKQENLVSHQERPDLVIKKCMVCGCRHFKLNIDPGIIGLKGMEMR